MPFDASAPAEVTARDRMIQLRDFLAHLPEGSKFNMSHFESSRHGCGTSACLAGWHGFLIGDRYSPRWDSAEIEGWTTRISTSLGLSWEESYSLFWGSFTTDPLEAVAVLDHYLATGEIDWAVAK